MAVCSFLYAALLICLIRHATNLGSLSVRQDEMTRERDAFQKREHNKSTEAQNPQLTCFLRASFQSCSANVLTKTCLSCLSAELLIYFLTMANLHKQMRAKRSDQVLFRQLLRWQISAQQLLASFTAPLSHFNAATKGRQIVDITIEMQSAEIKDPNTQIHTLLQS